MWFGSFSGEVRCGLEVVVAINSVAWNLKWRGTTQCFSGLSEIVGYCRHLEKYDKG